MAKEIFLVEGMSCASCALTIEKTVNQLPEVEQAVVNLATEKLTVTYQDDDLETAKVIQAVKAAGYGAQVFDEHAKHDEASTKASETNGAKAGGFDCYAIYWKISSRPCHCHFHG